MNSSTLISEDIENEEELTSEENVQEVEETTEETSQVEEKVEEQPEGRFYTDEEFNQKVNEIADRRVARKMRKLNRELDKYRDTENVLKSQLGGETIEEVNSNLRKLYTDEGVKLPEQYVSEDTDYLEYQAEKDSEDIIAEGYEAMKNEANRLAANYDNLNTKDKALFGKLIQEIDRQDDIKVLKGLNIEPSILENKEFINFRQQFNRNVPVSKIYEMYSGTQQENKINTPGSLKNNTKTESEYFTDEEIEALTMEDLDKPEIWEKLRRSQTRQK